MTTATDPAVQLPPQPPIAWDREETDSCQAGTPGCAIDHRPGTDDSCEGW